MDDDHEPTTTRRPSPLPSDATRSLRSPRSVRGRMSVSRSNGVVLVILLAAAAPIVSVVPATAASSNCVVLLVPGSVDPSGTILATEVDLGCYPTYAEALAAGSSGAIDVPALTTPASLTDAVLAADTIATAT